MRSCPLLVLSIVAIASTALVAGSPVVATSSTVAEIPFSVTTPSAQEVPETPGPQDVPEPVETEIGLAGQGKPDILRFLNVRTATSPSPSPDGERIAFATDITGKRQLWVVEAAGGWPRQLTFGEDGITFHQWSPRGDWIAYGADRGGNEREGIYLIDPAGTEERELLPPADAFRVFGGFSDGGEAIAYATTSGSGTTFDIHLLDVDSGEDRLLFEGRMGLYVASWSPDGSSLLLTESRGEDANDLFLLDLEAGTTETLFRPDTAAAYSDFAWLPDGSGFYLTTDQGREFAGLAFYDLASRELEWIRTPDHDVGSVKLDGMGRVLAWTTNEGGYSVLHAMRVESGEAVEAPELPPGVYSLDAAAESPLLAVTVRGPRVPGDIWAWPRPGESVEARRVTRSATAGLDPEQFVVPEHVDFPARDGVMLHGLLYLPRELPDDGRPPVLLGVHGGPTGQARPSFNAVDQYLLARGIAIFDLNFRGSTGYGKTFARLDNRRLRPDAVRDMADAVEFLRSDERVDAARMAVMGGSYGGYMTFAALTTYPELFDGGVSIVGVSNWVTALEGASPQLKASDRIEYGDIDDPEDREFFRRISPIHRVDRVDDPVMVIHGANDPRDPVTESDQFVRAIRERGGTVEYLRFPDEGHGIRKLSNKVIAYRRAAGFLESVLDLGEDREG